MRQDRSPSPEDPEKARLIRREQIRGDRTGLEDAKEYGVPRRKIMQRLVKTGKKAIPMELKLQIMIHVFHGWHYWVEEENENMQTTVSRLLEPYGLEELHQDAYNSLRSTAIYRCSGSMEGDCNIIHLIERKTRSFPDRENIVDFRLDVNLESAGTGSMHLNYNVPSVAAKALLPLPNLRQLTIRLFARDDIELLSRLTVMHSGGRAGSLQYVLASLQAMVEHKDIEVQLLICTRTGTSVRRNLNTHWSVELKKDVLVDWMPHEIMKTIGDGKWHTQLREMHEKKEMWRHMSGF